MTVFCRTHTHTYNKFEQIIHLKIYCIFRVEIGKLRNLRYCYVPIHSFSSAQLRLWEGQIEPFWWVILNVFWHDTSKQQDSPIWIFTLYVGLITCSVTY